MKLFDYYLTRQKWKICINVHSSNPFLYFVQRDVTLHKMHFVLLQEYTILALLKTNALLPEDPSRVSKRTRVFIKYGKKKQSCLVPPV